MRNQDRELKTLASRIALLQDVAPPPDLTAAVMQRVKPKKPTWRTRLRHKWRMALAARPIRLVPVGVMMVLVAAAAFHFTGQLDNQSEPVAVPSNAMTVHQTIAHRTVVFQLVNPMANDVAVIGTFNNWDPEGYRMHRADTDSPWVLSLDLAFGQYVYAFLIDDQWVVPDPQSLWQQDDGFGNLNSKLIVANGRANADDI